MKLTLNICDSCAHQCDDLARFSNGRGSGLDLCPDCVQKMVAKLLKLDLWVFKSLCRTCGGRGLVGYKGQLVECANCRQ